MWLKTTNGKWDSLALMATNGKGEDASRNKKEERMKNIRKRERKENFKKMQMCGLP